MESTQLTLRSADTDELALAASRFLAELGLPRCGEPAKVADSELLLVVGVLRKAHASAASPLYCAAMQSGTPEECERLVSAVSGLVRGFERAAENGTASRLPPPKWG